MRPPIKQYTRGGMNKMLPPMRIRFEKTVWTENGTEMYGYRFLGADDVLSSECIGAALDEYVRGPYIYSVMRNSIIASDTRKKFYILLPGDKVTRNEFRTIQKIVHEAGTRLGQIRRRLAWTGIEEIVE